MRPHGANFSTPRQGGGPVLRLYGANILTPRPGGGPVLRLYGAKFLTPRPGGGPVLRSYGANFALRNPALGCRGTEGPKAIFGAVYRSNFFFVRGILAEEPRAPRNIV